jgi:hypothetical protein
MILRVDVNEEAEGVAKAAKHFIEVVEVIKDIRLSRSTL